MEKQYLWIIDVVEMSPVEGSLQKVMKTIHWSYVRTEGNITGRAYGALQLPPPSEDNFTPYDNITKEQAIEWLKTILDEELLKQKVEEDIYNIKNPKVMVTAAPWNFANSSPSLLPSDAVVDNSPQSLAQTLMQEYSDKVAEVKFVVEKGLTELQMIKQQLEEIQTSQNNT